MKILIPFAALILAGGIMFICNSLALTPWRRSKEKHWSEQARLVFPVFVAARSNLLTIPSIFALIVVMIWPDSSPLWFFTGAAALLGAYAGMLPATLEVFPRIPLRELLLQARVGILLQLSIWALLITAAVFMPDEFNNLALDLGGGVCALLIVWSNGGLLWAARKLGVFLRAPERLKKIAESTSARMGIPFRDVLLVRAPVAQAAAVLNGRRLLFTERLLELLSDDEIAAICAHELAHLTESKSARFSRSIRMFIFLPWIYFKPIMHTFGIIGFFCLLFTTLIIPAIYRRISRKLESRADQMAKGNEGDVGTYARALARLYEDNLVPAVTSKEKATHPHLYDRMLAAGVTPDFPRPAPAKNMAWHGSLFAGLLGMLFAFFAQHSGHFLKLG